MLLRQSRRPSSPLRGHETTVQYLQRLGPEYIDLILEFSEWVLSEAPEDGLRVRKNKPKD